MTEWASEHGPVNLSLESLYHKDGWLITRYHQGSVYDGTEGELYQMTEDPLQMENRWEDPSLASLKSDLLADSVKRISQCVSQGARACACVTEPRHGEQQACPSKTARCGLARREEKSRMRRFSEADLPDLTGKTALVTGANTGLGFETARLLAEKGARVLIACRNKDKGIAAAERINQRLAQSRAAFVPLDLANLSSVRDVVGHVEHEASLDMLINNAGVMATPRMLTADGFELQFGVNHLGHFALTATLWLLLAQSSSPRVVTVSSLTHWLGRLTLMTWGRAAISAHGAL